MAQPFANGKARFAVLQSYDYQKNDAYATGSQSIEATVGRRTLQRSDRVMMFLGWGGLTVLAAIDSLPLGVEEVPVEEEAEEHEGDAGQGVSEGPRFYDYGPGTTFGFTAAADQRPTCWRCSSTRAATSIRSTACGRTTCCSAARRSAWCRCSGRWASARPASTFDRRTYFQDPDQTKKSYHYPQFRAFLTWSK